MPEANAARALQDWIHEMMAQKKLGFRAGAGGDPSGETLWLYFSRGEAIESRLVLRAGLRNGKPVVLVDRLEGDAFQVVGKMSELQREEPMSGV
jgi:hypothetical protein